MWVRRERKTGRTGFAHLFEHLLFLESENLGEGWAGQDECADWWVGREWIHQPRPHQLFPDRAEDALEKMIWAEADKLGWFINTVTDPVLAKEKQVVKNEKRQSIDNAPYGHTSYVIDKDLYPADHPYNWQVIGSLDDLQRATLADVKEFFRRWYVPNNVTLVVAGDFDTAQAKAWVEKYFSEIKSGEDVNRFRKGREWLSKQSNFYHEDNFATLPQLTRTWPTVEQYHPDSYPLAVLTQYLSQGKKAPFYQVLVEDRKLTDDVTCSIDTSELAGQIELSVRALRTRILMKFRKLLMKRLRSLKRKAFRRKI